MGVYVCPELIPKATNFVIDHLSVFGMQSENSNAIDVFDPSAFRLFEIGKILLRYHNVPGSEIFNDRIVERLNYVADVNSTLLRYLVHDKFDENVVPDKFKNENFMVVVRQGRLDSKINSSKNSSKKKFN